MRRANFTSLRQTGLSLIELMIAMLVGLILIAGVISVFLSSRKSYSINTAVGQIQEHGRFALDFIRHDTRMAGYLSCGVSGLNYASQLNPSAALPYNFSNSILGFEYNGTAPAATYAITAENPAPVAWGNWTPSLDPSLPTSGAGYAIPGSDVLVMSMSQGGMSPGYVTSVNPTDFMVKPDPGVTSGNILVVSNCVNTVIVQASGTPTIVAGGADIPASTGGLAPGNAIASIPPSLVGAQVGTAVVTAFYVGESADGTPALFQATTDASLASGFQLQELVPGVENMQVLYGVDVTGAGAPNEYDTADVVTAKGLWRNVASIRVALLLRSDIGAVTLPSAAVTYDLLGTLIQAPQDTRLRQIFTSTIALRNNLPNP
jgi:type IV pilus assembly protein PilW